MKKLKSTKIIKETAAPCHVLNKPSWFLAFRSRNTLFHKCKIFGTEKIFISCPYYFAYVAYITNGPNWYQFFSQHPLDGVLVKRKIK